ncbi:hypothetical protein Droror1_Dr00023488 [Drosera rotundifolia]
MSIMLPLMRLYSVWSCTGSGKIEQEIMSSGTYYIAIGSLNSEVVEVCFFIIPVEGYTNWLLQISMTTHYIVSSFIIHKPQGRTPFTKAALKTVCSYYACVRLCIAFDCHELL